MSLFRKLGRRVEQFKADAEAEAEAAAGDDAHECSECGARFDEPREQCDECGSGTVVSVDG